MKFTCKPYKSNNSRKTLQFYAVHLEGYVSGFHEILRISSEILRISSEILRISKDQQLPGMVKPMFESLLWHKKVNAISVIA